MPVESIRLGKAYLILVLKIHKISKFRHIFDIHTLYLQLLYNTALAYAKLEDWKKAEEHLTRAIKQRMGSRHNKIDKAMESILVRNGA